MSGRIRTLKPEWLEDELLAAASNEARVLSIALILMADDYGRGRANVAMIASEAWRFAMALDDGAHAAEVLAMASRAFRELLAMRFVVSYEVDRQRYFAIRNWTKHQKVDRPSKPRIPAPPDEEPPANGGAREDVSSDSRVAREGSETGSRLTCTSDLRPVPVPVPASGDLARAPDPPFDVEPEAKAVSSEPRAIVTRQYQAAYEAARQIPWMQASAYRGELEAIGAWCEAAGRREGVSTDSVVSRVLAAAFADPWHRSNGYPLKAIAKQIGELYKPPPKLASGPPKIVNTALIRSCLEDIESEKRRPRPNADVIAAAERSMAHERANPSGDPEPERAFARRR